MDSKLTVTYEKVFNCFRLDIIIQKMKLKKQFSCDYTTQDKLCTNYILTKPSQEKCNQPEGLIHVPSMAYMATHNKINFAIAALQCTRSSSVGINEYIIASIITTSLIAV